MGESRFLRHAPCDSCDSSDALAIYTDHTFCFNCQKFTKTEEGEEVKKTSKPQPVRPMIDVDLTVPWDADHYRGVPKKVLDQYGVYKYADGVAFHYRDKKGVNIAQKIRENGKTSWRGEAKKVSGFGSHLANPSHHDAIAICEGEMDAPSVGALFRGLSASRSGN